jgi:hypothetical protein
MLAVSMAYKEAIDASSRTFRALLELFINEGITATASASAGSNASEVCNGLYRPTDYNSVGSMLAPISQGWRGAAVSNTIGTIAAETITVTYSGAVTSKHLWVIGRLGNYPVDFSVEVQENGVWAEVATVVGNSNWYWFLQLPMSRVITAFRLTVTKISTANDNALVIECGIINKIVFTDADIQYATLLDEASSESRNPVGTLTSNELTFDLNNEDGWFTITNNGPLSGLIKPGLKVRMHTGILLPDGNFEFAAWGIFYVTDWYAPSSDLKATITANDKLLKLMGKPAQNRLPAKNVSLKGLFERLFISIGLTPSEYEIDATLTRVMPVCWMPAGTVGDVLQAYATAGLCAVYIDTDDKIRVVDILVTGVSTATLTEANQLVSFDNPQSFSNIYSSVNVVYKVPRLSDVTEIIRIENVAVATGGVLLSKIPFSSPVGNISYMMLLEAINSKITSITYGVQAADVSISNTGTSTENVTLVIYGQSIIGDGATVTTIDTELYTLWPDKVLEISSDFIQTESEAMAHADNLIKLAADPQAFYSLQVRGNPAIELMDTLTIQSANSIKTAQDLIGVVIRQQLTYDGGLEGTLLLRKPLV